MEVSIYTFKLFKGAICNQISFSMQLSLLFVTLPFFSFTDIRWENWSHSHDCTVNMKLTPIAGSVYLARKLERVLTPRLALMEANTTRLPAHLKITNSVICAQLFLGEEQWLSKSFFLYLEVLSSCFPPLPGDMLSYSNQLLSVASFTNTNIRSDSIFIFNCS